MGNALVAEPEQQLDARRVQLGSAGSMGPPSQV
jgi:hypothetical protein